MANNSGIEWTDASWNCLSGCEAISPGCAHCYAAKMTRRLEAMGQEDYSGLTTQKHFNGKVRCLPDKLAIPLGWRKPRRIFVNSMSDLFHEDVPDEFIDKVFAVMNATHYQLPIPADLNANPWHIYQVLTKRAERMYRYMESRRPIHWRKSGSHPIFAAGRGEGGALRGHGLDVMNAGACLSWPPPNVWMGVSVEDQQRADERIPWLLGTPAAVRFVSAEPLLGPIDFDEASADCLKTLGGEHGIQWVICGGESGPGSRPCSIEWIRSIRDQCADGDAACFIKQLGAFPTDSGSDGLPAKLIAEEPGIYRIPSIKDKKGGDMVEWPADLRVRQFPREAPCPA